MVIWRSCSAHSRTAAISWGGADTSLQLALLVSGAGTPQASVSPWHFRACVSDHATIRIFPSPLSLPTVMQAQSLADRRSPCLHCRVWAISLRTPLFPVPWGSLFPGGDRQTHPEGLWESLNERCAFSTEQLCARSVCCVFSLPLILPSSFFPPSFPLD